MSVHRSEHDGQFALRRLQAANRPKYALKTNVRLKRVSTENQSFCGVCPCVAAILGLRYLPGLFWDVLLCALDYVTDIHDQSSLDSTF